MIKKLLLTVLVGTLLLTLVTIVDPATGYTLATYTGMIVSVPIVAALRLALFIRGGI